MNRYDPVMHPVTQVITWVVGRYPETVWFTGLPPVTGQVFRLIIWVPSGRFAIGYIVGGLSETWHLRTLQAEVYTCCSRMVASVVDGRYGVPALR
jgi:hypothetical protein